MHRKWVLYHARQIDRTQAAAAVGRQRLFGARIRGLDHFAIRQVVVAVHQVDEQHTRFCVIVGALDDLTPQVTCANFAVNPQTIGALHSAGLLDCGGRFRLVHQLEFLIVFNRLHQGVGDADGNVEVAQIALVLGADEFFDIRMVAAQHAHLRTAPRPG